jgi:hypothetical protein
MPTTMRPEMGRNLSEGGPDLGRAEVGRGRGRKR